MSKNELVISDFTTGVNVSVSSLSGSMSIGDVECKLIGDVFFCSNDISTSSILSKFCVKKDSDDISSVILS